MTNMGAFRDRGITIVRGEASTVWDDAGKALIDISGALWYANIGHGRAELADVAAEQMRTLEAYKTYDGFTSPKASRSHRTAAHSAWQKPPFRPLGP